MTCRQTNQTNHFLPSSVLGPVEFDGPRRWMGKEDGGMLQSPPPTASLSLAIIEATRAQRNLAEVWYASESKGWQLDESQWTTIFVFLFNSNNRGDTRPMARNCSISASLQATPLSHRSTPPDTSNESRKRQQLRTSKVRGVAPNVFFVGKLASSSSLNMSIPICVPMPRMPSYRR